MKGINRIFFFGVILFSALQGNDIVIHEGLVAKVSEVGPQLALSMAPPTNLNETPTKKPSKDAIWLPGYWVWEEAKNDFTWINGFWRKPPPEKKWIQGKWQKLNRNWVWLTGFWSDKDLDTIDFIASQPPDLIEEEIAKPINEHYFWVPGHYIHHENAYKWNKGYWEKFDSNWILTPAHYVWRPEGFIFIAAFWDWPLSERGQINAVSLKDIITKLFYSYPDYLHFFTHYNYFHKNSIQDAPPWWSWQTWWTYNWSNQWALWWWYTHPGYVQPKWMTSEISQHIMPPSNNLEMAAQKIKPPLIVTETGIVSNRKVAKVARKLENNTEMTLSAKNLLSFQNAIQPKRKLNFKALKPNGKTNAMLLSRAQFVQKQERKNSRSPIKPYLKKLKNKLVSYQDLAVDNTTTDTQRYWEEEIRDRDKRRSSSWEARKKEFNESSSKTTDLWNEGIRERNEERGSYADETYRHNLKDYNKEQFWQPQIEAREREYSEERRAIEEEKEEHYQEEQEAYKRIYGDTLSYSRDDARRDAIRSDNRRYMQNRENIRRDNLRYMQNQQNIKRDNLQYELKQENLQQDRLKDEQRQREKEKEDQKFWEELRKLEKERGDLSFGDEEKHDIFHYENNQEDEEHFWNEQEREKDEVRKRASEVQVDIRKFGSPLPESKYYN